MTTTEPSAALLDHISGEDVTERREWFRRGHHAQWAVEGIAGDPTEEDWPAWARELAERYHPNRPRDDAGADLDPTGSYV